MLNRVLAGYQYDPFLRVFFKNFALFLCVPLGLVAFYLGAANEVGSLTATGLAVLVTGIVVGSVTSTQNASSKKNRLQVTEDSVRVVFRGKSQIYRLDEIAEVSVSSANPMSIIVSPKRGGRMVFTHSKNANEVAGAFLAAKMAKVRAKMTDAEWENYKLQLENNQLLNQLAKRGGNRGNRASYGFVSEVVEEID